ncbi:hypothetical protein HYX19_00715 [Candidatus Woesearchaeota archaeon]|nr:hypothetical protein [Candidatus Woesearchaeota archaeon]
MKIPITLLFLLLSTLPVLALDNIYLVELSYSNGKFNFSSIGVMEGFYREKSYNENLEYNIKVIKYDSSVLWENNLPIGNVIYFEDERGGGAVTLKNVNLTETLPFFNSAKYIKIYKKDSEVFSIDITKYSNYCGNNICNNEDKITCPQDCRTGEKTTEKKFSTSSLITILAAIIIMLVLYIIYKKNK